MGSSRQRTARAVHRDRVDVAPSILLGLPAALLAASVAATLLTGVTTAGRTTLMGVLAVLALALHAVWLRARALSSPVRVAVLVANLALTAALVGVSPYFGIYAYVAYLTALLLFSGPALWAAMAATALLAATAQVGGYGVVPDAWAAWAVLVAVNTGLAVVVTWVGARRDREVARREAAVAALEQAQRRNAELQEELLARARDQGMLQERARLSREIHDTVAQDLVAIVSQLEAIDGGEDWAPRVATAKELGRTALGEARRAVHALRSPLLDAVPLPTALSDLLGAWESLHGVRTTLRVEGDPVLTDADPDLLRVCQEALSNVARHASATRVSVHLAYAEEGVLLDVSDDGTGFDPARRPEGTGLRGMRERMAGAGGSVEVSTRPGGGCLVTAAVPT